MAKLSKWKPGKWKPKKGQDRWPQGYMHPSTKILRKRLKRVEVSDGNMYRKVGGWFEWN